ncbi:hypothetical protein EIN_376420 [Entamoeba invadens IP1]|uniref:Furin repeat-containing protein n=1 Tax=Entamoeba invadens IP1 TaxID=370355 RepID=A0A0A1TU58_ENTIV|nr:hypothetical protein EIN_376420 [Entamoeba invadens IP1]ELP83477.1 hypothetical protein EIN_376420 [Entamoeba invadens IP1]|eukprot:XP_004182823.1 hypothetical protein EIN_376420 [Entamoeba invadens IP1]
MFYCVLFFVVISIASTGKEPDPHCSSAYCASCSEMNASNCMKCIENYINVLGTCEYMTTAHCLERTETRNVNSIYTTNCTKCEDGYQLESNTCVQSVGVCDTFSADGKCFSCQVGSYMSAEKVCVDCGTYDPFCRKFSNKQCTTCTVCKAGSVLINGKCHMTIPFCNTYVAYSTTDSVTKCKTCEDGYYLLSGRCILGSLKHCREYYNSSICVKCFDGFVLETTPDNKVKINIDKDNTFLYSTNIVETRCTPIRGIGHCLQYSFNELKVCLECEKGYYLNEGNVKCVKGSTANCVSYFTSGHCSKCSEGYYVDLGVCVKCTEQDLFERYRCTQCKSTIQTALYECVETHCVDQNIVNGVCVTCESGYVTDTTSQSGNCVKSNNNCVKTSNEKCVLCTTGYYLNSSFECEKCDSNYCVHCINSAKTCDRETSFYQKTVFPTCEDKLCKSCLSDNKTCVECFNGEIADSYGKCSDIICSKGIDGLCLKCTQYTPSDDSIVFYDYLPTDGICLPIDLTSGSMCLWVLGTFIVFVFF